MLHGCEYLLRTTCKVVVEWLKDGVGIVQKVHVILPHFPTLPCCQINGSEIKHKMRSFALCLNDKYKHV